jgi:protocatechuate 3,4-dioxygenase beta subunit
MKALMLTWMFQNALLGGGLLTAGCFLAARCRSPVRRLRLLDWTLVAALIAPLLASTEGPWKLPLRWLPPPLAPGNTIVIPSAPQEAAAQLTRQAIVGYEHETGDFRAAKSVVGDLKGAVRPPIAKSWNWPDWRDVVLAIEALAIVFLAAKWLVSALALSCLSYCSKTVDANVAARIDEQLPARLRPSATIRLDPNVSTPCVFGLFRPCILLPEFLAHAERAQQMIFALAHESSHLLRGDLWSWRLVRIAQFALWFQPAYWWLRRHTRLCQDFLADFDATMVGKATDLADFLVQLARMQQTGGPRGQTPFPPGSAVFFLRKSWWSRAVLAEKVSVPSAALSMSSRRTDLAQRIHMLLQARSQLENRCPRRFQALAALAVFSIIGVAAVLRLEAQDRTESKAKEGQPLAGLQSNPAITTQVRGRVLGPDGKPVAGAKLYLGAVSESNTGQRMLHVRRGDHEEMKPAVRATSDSDGHFRFTFSNAELMAMDGGDLMDVDHRDLLGEVMAVAPGHGCGWVEIDSAAGELTIRLVDDLPVEGCILDSDGHPVAGARIRMIGIGAAPREDSSALLDAVQKGHGFTLGKVWNGSLPGRPTITTTGRDGRFQLSGIGRDRLVRICIEGPSIATAFHWVMTRTGETVKQRDWWNNIFAASFEFVGQPGRWITGTVRNKTTGKPMAGVSVSLGGRDALIRTVTDNSGHYDLRGVPKGPTYWVVAAPDDGLFFERHVELQDSPGLGNFRCDIELVSGLTAHGRVTDEQTGKPIAGAQVDYHPVGGNPYASKLLPGHWMPRSEARAGLDGSYTLTVMPGPGVIGVKAPKLTAYAPAVVTVEERKQFFKSPLVFKTFAPINNEDNYLNTAGGGSALGVIGVDFYNALTLIEPGEEERPIVKDVALRRPQELKGKILGPDNQPLMGTTVYGLVSFGNETLKGSEFTVRGVNPKAKRSLVFYHKEKQLGYYLKVLDAKSNQPFTVKLQPCGSVSGRIVDAHGPVAGAVVDVLGTALHISSEAGGGYHRVVTDANGRFNVAGLVAGQEYAVQEIGDRGPSFPRFYVTVTVASGQHKDLGDIKMEGPDQ